MSYQNDLSKFRDIAKSVISKLNLRIDADDLINDVYLHFHNSGEEYSFETVSKYFYKIAYKAKENPLNIEVNSNGVYQSVTETQLICKGCQDQFPVDLFYKTNRIRSPYYSLCIPCTIKRATQYYIDNKEKIQAWYQLNKEQRSEYMKEWRKKNVTKEYRTFTNGYIRQLMIKTGNYTKEILDKYPVLIEEKRNELIKWRSQVEHNKISVIVKSKKDYNNRAVLNKEQVAKVRKMLLEKSINEVAVKFQVSYKTIWKIKSGVGYLEKK